MTHSRRVLAPLLSALMLAACTPPPQQATTRSGTPSASALATPQPTTPLPAGQVLGQPGCRPASPWTPWSGTAPMPEIRGTTSGGELWALVEANPPPLPQGRDIKIIWRMTGNGRELVLSASGPGGRTAQPDWGPELHGSSNWDRPGLEWGAGFTFAAPGCWDIHATQGHLAGDVYLMIR